MRRLYLRIYLAMLASLLLFALIAALGWKLSFDRERASRDERALIAEVVAAILPPADAPADAQRAALERWHARTGADLALFGPDRAPIASAGRPLPPPKSEEGGREGGVRWGPWRDAAEHAPPAWSVRLPDGRWAVARMWRFTGGPPVAWGGLLLALTVAVAVGAYPVVRRLTRRLERLQQGVEALGAGDLSARVEVKGRDEVAALAASFNRSAERIEALVAAQKSLLANASHELRSPLARLKMATALLSDPQAAPAGEAQRRALRDEVELNVAELDALIEEILLASRLDAAGAPVAREPVDLLALLAEEAARARATLSFDGDAATAPIRVDGDPRLLRRMVRNLLENARRHGAGTPVEVVARREPIGPAFDVLDRGPGVPEAERERIFEPFHRVSGHGEGAGGVGLGLSLVRQIAQRHAATVTCLPREGGGSRFAVRFGAAR
ncbi:MAG: HAMP domain-containing sensor histidine kinase [Burkholderiaceae bacterium]|jgi:signal transduction histidine kinase|nr:HAMP domain-containing histidine kinase [Burkholderiales bacterium]MCZ8099580.1 HAMP domain-containing sensor histidine kinase [Burkholderiales bacterium]MCZ8339337.1 HAMP domain-containing sensor histidine kinase [Burkholderiaceae bacterium]